METDKNGISINFQNLKIKLNIKNQVRFSFFKVKKI